MPLLLRPARQVLQRHVFSGWVSRVTYSMTKFADLPVRQVLNSEVISPTIVLHRLWHSELAYMCCLCNSFGGSVSSVGNLAGICRSCSAASAVRVGSASWLRWRIRELAQTIDIRTVGQCSFGCYPPESLRLAWAFTAAFYKMSEVTFQKISSCGLHLSSQDLLALLASPSVLLYDSVGDP